MLSFGAIASKVFGSLNERKLKKYGPVVAKINALEPEIAVLSDDELRARTEDFRARVQAGTELDDLIPEAFATVREAAKRTLGQRHFDVQLIGGMVLHEGRIAEMKTGEGKTLVATLPSISTRCPAAACMSSPSTTTSPSATRRGWARFTISWGSASAASCTS